MVESFSHSGWVVRCRHHPTEGLAEGEVIVHWLIHRNLGPLPRHSNAPMELLDTGKLPKDARCLSSVWPRAAPTPDRWGRERSRR